MPRIPRADRIQAGPEHRPLAPDVVLMLVSKVAVLLLTLVSTIIVARSLGPTGRGAVAVAFSFAVLLVQFGSVGLQTANPYFAARDPARLGRIVANSLWLAFGLGTLLVLAGLAVKLWFPAAVRGLSWEDMTVVLIGLPALLASTLLQSVLLAEGRMVAYNLVELAGVAAMVAGLWVGLATFDVGVFGAIAIISAANIGTSIVFLGILMRHRPAMRQPDFGLMRAMIRYGFRVYVATLIAFLVGRVNLILVNSLLGSSAAGLFSTAVALEEGMRLLPGVIALNLFPRVARGGSSERSAVVFRTTAVLFGGLCLLTIPLAGPVIRMLYGETFEGATSLYLWLLPGIYAYGMLNVLSQHFAGRGFPRQAMLVWIPGLALNLAIVLVLLPGGPVYVASLAASIAYCVVLVLHVHMFAREAGSYRMLIPRPIESARLIAEALRSLRPSRP